MKLIIVRAAVVGHRQTSVRLTCTWTSTRKFLLTFATQTFVWCTIIVWRKRGAYRLRTFTGWISAIQLTETWLIGNWKVTEWHSCAIQSAFQTIQLTEWQKFILCTSQLCLNFRCQRGRYLQYVASSTEQYWPVGC